MGDLMRRERFWSRTAVLTAAAAVALSAFVAGSAAADNMGCCVFDDGSCTTSTRYVCGRLGGTIQGVGTEYCDAEYGCLAGTVCSKCMGGDADGQLCERPEDCGREGFCLTQLSVGSAGGFAASEAEDSLACIFLAGDAGAGAGAVYLGNRCPECQKAVLLWEKEGVPSMSSYEVGAFSVRAAKEQATFGRLVAEAPCDSEPADDTRSSRDCGKCIWNGHEYSPGAKLCRGGDRYMTCNSSGVWVHIVGRCP